jgi:hypothetical protein
MKRILFCLPLLCILFSIKAVAQTVVFSEDFQGGSGPALPAGWSNVSTDNPGWIAGTSSALSGGIYNVPSHTRFAGINDAEYNTNLPGHNNINDQLVSPSFSLATLTAPYIQFSQFFSGQAETATVQVSTNGGATWTYIDSLYFTGMPLTWSVRQISLQQFAGMPNVKVRFGYSDGGGWGGGNAIDDIKVFQPENNDVAVDTVVLGSIITNNTPLRVTVMNRGAQVITSLSMNYTINGGTPVAQSFTGLQIIPFTTDTLIFSSPVNNLAGGENYTATVNALSVNGNTDAHPADNQAEKVFALASTSVQRAVLFELSTSSTCPPCAGFGDYYDPIWLSMGANNPDSNFNVIKYQQNFPAPYDSSYNIDAAIRMNYYYSGGIPSPTVDGHYGVDDEVIARKSVPAYITLSGAYAYDANTDSATLTIHVTPHFTASGNFKLRVALTEDHYQNPGNLNGELDYYNVERNMLPDANGTAIDTFVDGQTQTFIFKTEVTSGVVRRNTHTFWGDPQNSHLVAFVQDDDTKEVLQSMAVGANHTTGIATIPEASRLSIYPNPSGSFVNIAFTLEKGQAVLLGLTDMTGRTVYHNTPELNAGNQLLVVPTANLPTGFYIVHLQTARGNAKQKLSVIHP